MPTWRNLRKKTSSPGIGSTVWLGPLSSFDTIAGLNTTGTNPGDSVTITDDHTFLTGKGFIEMYSTQEFSDLTGESKGEADSKTMGWNLKVWHPGSYEEASEFVKNALTEEGFICLVKDADCSTGKVVQIGTHCTPAKPSPKFESGTLGNGKKGWEITFSADNPFMIFYKGDITVQP